MKYSLILLVLASGCHLSQSHARISVAEKNGAWTREQIEQADWIETVKTHCIDREVVPGMTTQQLIASWGEPNEKLDLNGVRSWIFDKYDVSVWDRTYIPQRAVRLSPGGIVQSVSSSG